MKELQPVIKISVQGQIEDNISELKLWVTSMIEKYKDLVVTDIPEGKDVLKNLRALKKAINEERIRVKKIFLTPYDELEEKINPILDIIDSAQNPIEAQIKKAEQVVAEQRKTKILGLLEEEAKSSMSPKAYNFSQSVPWLFDTKWTQESYWTNTGNPTKKLKDGISDVIKQCDNGVSSILMVAGEFTDQVLELFRVSGSLGNALSALDDMKKAKERAEQLKTKEEPVIAPVVEEAEQVGSSEFLEDPQETEEELPVFMRDLQEVVDQSGIEIPSTEVPFMMEPQVIKEPLGSVRRNITIRFELTEEELHELEGLFTLTGVVYEVLG